MDHFGIGNAIRAQVLTYRLTSRRTGRTSSLVESLKTGDRVVFLSPQEARRVQALCKDRGVEIKTLVHSPADLEKLFHHPCPTGNARTVFDHEWVEAYYERAIERAREELTTLQQDLSGRGEPHRETKRKAQEIAKWQI